MDYIKKVCSGRVGRKSFILGYLLIAVVFIATVTILAVLAMGLALLSSRAIILALIIYVLLILAYQFYGISLCVRRLHDLNKSGWYALLFFIPFINIYWAIILLFKKGEESENKYGVLDKDAALIKTVFKF